MWFYSLVCSIYRSDFYSEDSAELFSFGFYDESDFEAKNESIIDSNLLFAIVDVIPDALGNSVLALLDVSTGIWV